MVSKKEFMQTLDTYDMIEHEKRKTDNLMKNDYLDYY